jgi:TonB dependent receptor/Carboxypeptidase regulatory-like domain
MLHLKLAARQPAVPQQNITKAFALALLLTLNLVAALVAPAQKTSSGVARSLVNLEQSDKIAAVKSNSTAQQKNYQLLVKVVDETGVAVADALLLLTDSETHTVLRSATDASGRHEFMSLGGAIYQLKVEKEGFYAAVVDDFRLAETTNLEITLYHQQEIAETVNVYDSPRTIDPEKTAVSEKVSSREILSLPYPSTHDYRKVLPLIPGVIADNSDQIHLGGSSTYQIFDQLDGFNITQPVNGLLVMRVSPDALRAIDVQSSRLSAQYGKGSGGNLNLTSGMGDDRYRFSATNFIPSPQTVKGVNFSEWTPRATFSGPLRKKKAWFFEAADADVNQKIVSELPNGADRNTSWRADSLLKAQFNLSDRNILSAGFLLNRFHSGHEGLSRFDPLETTTDVHDSAYLASLKDQLYTASGALLEIGFAVNQFHDEEQPMGNLPYKITPEGTSGNFFKSSTATARRLEWIGILTLPSIRWHGVQEFKLGVDLDRITYDQLEVRHPILVLRENGTLSRQITFPGNPQFSQDNFEGSAFAQDRWSISNRLLVEAGLRYDRDSIIRRGSVSPRIATTYLLTEDGGTKLSGGVGLYYDATNLDLITRPLAGRRFDQLYAGDGVTPLGPPVTTSFQVNERSLKVPRFTNWSAGWEQKLPAQVYLDVEFLQKRGHNGFAFFNLGQPGQVSGALELRSDRRDRYDGLQITVRRDFKSNYAVLASYGRSTARSNAVLDFDIDNVSFREQAGGPLLWDSPNRFITWGWLPLVKKFDFAYSLDWREGFPFSVVNQEQQIIGLPNSQRFPTYFTLNTHIERRFHLFGYYLALRAGFNNVTNQKNPTVVNNNVDSPEFLSFGGTQHRVFTGRIRFLGRK